MLDARDEVFPILEEALVDKHQELCEKRNLWQQKNWAFETCFNNRPIEFSRQGVKKLFDIMSLGEKCMTLEREIRKIEVAVKEYFTEEIPQRTQRIELSVEEAKQMPCEDVIKQFGVELKRSGRQLRGCCPLHNEKTPSFFVDTDKNVWYCQGCHKGGDSIRFIEEIRQCDFVSAVRYLTT